jgi:hypothetical protein
MDLVRRVSTDREKGGNPMREKDFAEDADGWLQRLSDDPEPALPPESSGKRENGLGRFNELTGDLFPIGENGPEDSGPVLESSSPEPAADNVEAGAV